MWMPHYLTNEKSTLVQVMVWCHQTPSHHLSHCWPIFMSPYGVTRPQWVNTGVPWDFKGSHKYRGEGCTNECMDEHMDEDNSIIICFLWKWWGQLYKIRLHKTLGKNMAKSGQFLQFKKIVSKSHNPTLCPVSVVAVILVKNDYSQKWRRFYHFVILWYFICKSCNLKFTVNLSMYSMYISSHIVLLIDESQMTNRYYRSINLILAALPLKLKLGHWWAITSHW